MNKNKVEIITVESKIAETTSKGRNSKRVRVSHNNVSIKKIILILKNK